MIRVILLISVSIAGLATADETAEGRVPTFTRDVLPILQRHCQQCHRPGQIGPMSLVDYQQVRPWAKAIRQAVAERVMPPFHANAPLGHFRNDIRLTDAQIDTVLRWIDGGVPQGDPKDAPPPLQWNDRGWAMGEPDLVVDFPEVTSKTNNRDEELLLYGDYVFPQDTWVQALEFRSSDYRLVHHSGVVAVNDTFFVPPDRILDSEDEHLDKFGGTSNGGLPLLGQNYLYTWLPGQNVERRTQGEGYKIAAGERLVLQVHIPPTTEAIPIKISIGLKFVNGDLIYLSGLHASEMKSLLVPANANNYEMREWRTFGSDGLVTGFKIHMHLRGKSAKIIFHYPDNRQETVLDVPRFDFDWQRNYDLVTPMLVPSGTKVEYIATWDNSAENPLNPDPSVDVKWGPLTTQEMFGGNVYFYIMRKGPLRIKNGVLAEYLPAPASIELKPVTPAPGN